MIGRFLLRLLFASKLNPLQVLQLDPDSRYLVVVSLKDKLSMEAIARMQVSLGERFSQFFEGNVFGIVILEDGAEMNFYQFKETKSDGRL